MSLTEQDAVDDNSRINEFHCSLIEAIVVSVPWVHMQYRIMLFSQMLPAWRIALATYKAANNGQSLSRKAVFMGGRYRLLTALPIADAMAVVRDNLDESQRILSAESDQLARELQLMREQAVAVITADADEEDDDIGEAIQM